MRTKLLVGLIALVCVGCGGGGSSSPAPITILISSDFEASGNTEIYKIVGSAVPVRLTNSAGEDGTVDVVGNSVVFFSTRNGRAEIFKMNLDGSNLQRLTNNTATDRDDMYPRLSPDGTRILFRRTDLSGGNLFVMDADGTNVTQLTTNGGFSGCWSPDGSRVAFSGDELSVINADGSGLIAITSNMDTTHDPTWTTAGIVFGGSQAGIQGLWRIDAIGNPPVRLTTTISIDEQPEFTPDRTAVVFARLGDILTVPLAAPNTVTTFVDLGGNETGAAFSQ